MSFKEFCDKLEAKIVDTYEQGVSLEDAEKLAAEFLHAQMVVSVELKKQDLDARMRKSGLKAVKAAVYLQELQKSDKKPADSVLSAIIDSNDVVQSEQDTLDKAEVSRDELDRIFNVFQNGHIYYRSVSRGRFE